ncbi:hypothetical protein SRDD_06580 [Serratia sp. DD3]|nr:hypothetical protein SRDD_06580 [Serratia sp. DD3]
MVLPAVTPEGTAVKINLNVEADSILVLKIELTELIKESSTCLNAILELQVKSSL